MNPGYFNMLDQSLNGESSSSRRRLPGSSSSNEPLLRVPLHGAEFVASEPRTPPTAQSISPAAFSQNYFKTFFREERELGKGGKGVVVLVTHILDGCELGQFACKRVPVGNNHSWLEKVLLEVKTLQNLSHPNLVSYRHVWLEDYKVNNFAPKVPFCFILQQFCNRGDLQNYVLNQPRKSSMTKQDLKTRLRRRSKGHVDRPEDLNLPRRLPFEEIFAFFMDITAGLHYLHSHGFIHRDIKPSNCLLHVENNGRAPRILLSDFGEVQVTNTLRSGTGATGTLSYCAPEVLRKDGLFGALGNFTVKSDIFSVGMIVFFMCFAHLPYSHSDGLNEDNEDVDLLREEILAWAGFDDDGARRGRSDLPGRMYSFLKRLLAVDPSERPTTSEILASLKSNADSSEDFERHSPVEERHPQIPHSRISAIDSPRLRGKEQLALPAPPSSSITPISDLPRVTRQTPPFLTLVKLIYFAWKFYTLSHPCYTLPMQSPITVALMFLAAVDLVYANDNWQITSGVSFGLMVVHTAVVWGFGLLNRTCENRMG
jgi:serine/threonine protein kinase